MVSIYTKDMPALDEAVEALMYRSLARDREEAFDQFGDAIDAILGLSSEELKLIPPALLEELKMMMEHAIFSEDIASELRKKLKGI